MTLNLDKDCIVKKNLKLILNSMLPGDNNMPCFTKHKD